MTGASPELERWLRERLLDVVPMAIAVVDRNFEVVYANGQFERLFGAWRGRKCFAVYKRRDSPCQQCRAVEAFRDGLRHVGEEQGVNQHGEPTHYIKHTIPMVNGDGEMHYVVELSTDISDIERLRQEHKALLDNVPCKILVLDPELRIVRTNQRVHERFGDVEGRYCYEVLKARDEKCSECPALETFRDAQVHTGHSVVDYPDGSTVHLQLTTTPLEKADGKVTEVLEMAVDVTKTWQLQEQLEAAHAFVQTVMGASPDGIVGLDASGEVTVFNRAARDLVRASSARSIDSFDVAGMLPEGLLTQVAAGPGQVNLPDSEIRALDGERIPARLVGVRLGGTQRQLGTAVFMQDLRVLRQLEKEKLDAERLAAVGQTVAGLAHGVKNLITSLEGGMYLLETGLKKGEPVRIEQGWEMLSRNVERISVFVRNFLSFSRGRKIQVERTSPGDVAKEVVAQYGPRAEGLGIELRFHEPSRVEEAPIDREGIHECLTNLVGNAIDACEMSTEGAGRHVDVRCLERDGAVLYEVADDGCGMDYEVKRKLFTTFFTTKGLGGTGLGLLMTRKIVQEHGGRIGVESEVGHGTTFRIVLPRAALPRPDPEELG